MTPELLRRAGEALYGPRWQSELARDLDISDRSMRTWAKSGAPESATAEIIVLLEKRTADIAELVAEINGRADA